MRIRVFISHGPSADTFTDDELGLGVDATLPRTGERPP